MLRLSKVFKRRTAGFSLIEIMVGLAIGMLAIIVILQVFSLSEQRKRTTTGGGDAQSTGAIVFYRLQQDIAQAGYGMNSPRLFNCQIKWPIAGGGNITTAVNIAPVTINPPVAVIPAGDPNTDTLLVMYGNTNSEPEGNPVQAQSGSTYTVGMVEGVFAVNDNVIAVPDVCTSELLLDKVTAIDSIEGTLTTANNKTATTLYNFGAAPVLLAYAVRAGNLTVCDYAVNDCGLAADKDDPSVWVPIASNVVSMRAQYARDTTATMDAIPDIYDQTTPTSSCGVGVNGWARIPALRLVLVARSSQYEKDVVTANAPTWAGTSADNPVGSASTPIDLTKNPDNTANTQWQHYRYKLFETVVPMRNVAWMGVPDECL